MPPHDFDGPAGDVVENKQALLHAGLSNVWMNPFLTGRTENPFHFSSSTRSSKGSASCPVNGDDWKRTDPAESTRAQENGPSVSETVTPPLTGASATFLTSFVAPKADLNEMDQSGRLRSPNPRM